MERPNEMINLHDYLKTLKLENLQDIARSARYSRLWIRGFSRMNRSKLIEEIILRFQDKTMMAVVLESLFYDVRFNRYFPKPNDW